MTLAEVKRQVRPGQVYDVTNHYITRASHPAYGTTRRRVHHVTGSSVYLLPHPLPGAVVVPRWPTFTWPRAAQVQMDADGTIRLYGGGAGQKPEELFLTLTPVQEG